MPPPAEGFASRLVLGPALRAQPDRRLVMLVREGYELAFEEIVRRYRTPLGRYAAAIVGGRSEDVTQDAFSKALLAMRRDDSEIDLSPWLYRIVRNTALNDLRDRPAAAEELAEAIAGGRSPAEAIEEREELTDLITRLQALPQPQRAAIVMRELEGLSHDEIATALGLSGGAARQAIYRARQALRDGLGMLVPLPALKALLSHAGPGAAEAAAGAAGVGGAAGAGVAFKATAATVLVAGAVGAGIAVDHPHESGARKDRAGGDRVIARQSPGDTSRLGAGEAAATTSTPHSGGESAAGGGGRLPEPGAGTGGDAGTRMVPASHRPRTSGRGGSEGDDDTAHEVASGPRETSDDSRHGALGTSEDDGDEQLGDGSEHQGGTGSGSDSAEQTSGGDGASTESDHEESHLEEGGGDGGSSGGDSATVDESSTSVSDH